MKKRVPLTLITFAFTLACGAAFAEESPGIRSHDGHRGHASMMGCGMMARGGMMGGSGTTDFDESRENGAIPVNSMSALNTRNNWLQLLERVQDKLKVNVVEFPDKGVVDHW
jgi:hypothetical protein